MKFNIKNARKCGATSKRTKLPCQAPAMKNGRCRLHGGKSTGAKTAEGLEKIRQANLRSGRYTKEAIENRRYARWFFKNFDYLWALATENEKRNRGKES